MTDTTPVDATPPAPVPPTPASRSGSRWLNVVLVLAAGLAIAGVAFAIGRATVPSALDQLRADGFPGGGSGQVFVGGGDFPGGQANGQGQSGVGGRIPFLATGGGLALEGTVERIDGDSLTLRTADGEAIEVTLDGDTTYHTASAGSADSVTAGSKVVVRMQPGIGRGQAGGTPALGADDVTVVP